MRLVSWAIGQESLLPGQAHQLTLLKYGIRWGTFGGLIATLSMDVILMGFLTAAGLPALTCFSIVGNTVAEFLLLSAIDNYGTIFLGLAAHYTVGPLMGGIYGAAVAQIIALVKNNALQVTSLKKSVLNAVIYAQIMSQPILALSPILLKMTLLEIAQWYTGSFVMHLIWGCVLGFITWRRLPVESRAWQISG
jgi:hypothetical protein